MQQKPPVVPVLVQLEVFIVRFAVQVESPTSAEIRVPLNFSHSHWADAQIGLEAEHSPTVELVWVPVPRMVKAWRKAWVGEGTAVGPVAVAEVVTSGKTPLPHPELGTIANVIAAIVSIGRRRAKMAPVLRRNTRL